MATEKKTIYSTKIDMEKRLTGHKSLVISS